MVFAVGKNLTVKSDFIFFFVDVNIAFFGNFPVNPASAILNIFFYLLTGTNTLIT